MADIKIYGKLVNATTEGKIVGTDQAYDDTQKKFQSQINAEVKAQLGDAENGLSKKVNDIEKSLNEHKGAVTGNPHKVTKADVGLGNVTNDAQVKRSEMGVASGVATLGADGKIPSAQLPSFVDDVLEFDNKTAFPVTGEAGKIYIAKDTNLTYRWGGSSYVEISPSIALGETAGTAYEGSKGKATTDKVNAHVGNKENPHGVTKAQVGLGNVLDVKQIPASEKGAASGVATLDEHQKLTATQLPDSIANDFAAIYEIMYNQHATVSISTNVSGNIIEKGVPKSVTINWSYVFNGKPTTPDTSLQLKSGGSVLVSDKNTKTFTESISDTKAYQAVAVMKGVTKTAGVTVSAYYPIYYGSSAKTVLTSEDVLAFTKHGSIKSNPSGSYTFNVNEGHYAWICVPAGMTINKVTSSGFGVPMEPLATVAVTGKGNYNCYRSSGTFKAGPFNCVVG